MIHHLNLTLKRELKPSWRINCLVSTLFSLQTFSLKQAIIMIETIFDTHRVNGLIICPANFTWRECLHG